MPNDYYRAFWLDGSFDRPERPQIWSQISPRCDGRWCASGFGHRGSSLQWYIVPGAACHICELKRPVSRYLAQEDYYGRSGAHLQLYCDVAGEALGLAIIRPTERCRNHGPLTAKALKIALVLMRCDHVASPIVDADDSIM